MINPEPKRFGLIFFKFYDIIYVYQKVGEVLAHQVTCVYCKEVFDRDVIPYVISGYRRYGHADCYNKHKQSGKESRELEIVDPSSIIECIYCKKQLNKQTDNYVKVRQSLYAHKECAEAEAARTKTEDEILENYICNLLSLDFLSPRIKKQITQYKNQYHYTANGILKALVYFYEVKNNDIKKSNDGIGIVPYVYLEAFNYYYALWQAQQTNQDKVISNYVPKEIEVVIPVPTKENKMKRLFSFLDKDEIDGE